MADGDIVIIGIGHCRTANGASTNITDPSLLAKAINLGIIPKGSTIIYNDSEIVSNQIIFIKELK